MCMAHDKPRNLDPTTECEVLTACPINVGQREAGNEMHCRTPETASDSPHDTRLALGEGDSGQQRWLTHWLRWHNLETGGILQVHEHLDPPGRRAGLNIARADVMDQVR